MHPIKTGVKISGVDLVVTAWTWINGSGAHPRFKFLNCQVPIILYGPLSKALCKL